MLRKSFKAKTITQTICLFVKKSQFKANYPPVFIHFWQSVPMVENRRIHCQTSELFETRVRREDEYEGILSVYFFLDCLSLFIFLFLTKTLFLPLYVVATISINVLRKNVSLILQLLYLYSLEMMIAIYLYESFYNVLTIKKLFQQKYLEMFQFYLHVL